MRKGITIAAALCLLAASLLTGCTSADAGKQAITVGSKIDTEGALLANMMILLLTDAEIDVVDRSSFGPTQIVREALLSGEIDVYPEYTGNGAFFFDMTDSDVWNDAEQGYQTVAELDLQENGVVWLQPAPANNTWAIAVPQALAEDENLDTLEDFADYVNDGGYVKLAASEEFVTSPVALPAFEEAYGFDLSEDQLLTLSGGNTAQTEQAAAQGTDGVNAAMAYGTDGSLSALDLVVLEDPLGAQPIYQPAPIVRGEVYQNYPEMSDILDPVFKTLTLETLQTLNARIALEGEDPGLVAGDYLRTEGFLAS